MGYYVTPNGTIVDENDRMPGDVPYSPSSPRPTTTGRATTSPMYRWEGRKSTSPPPGAARTKYVPPERFEDYAKPVDQAGAQATVAGVTSALTSSIPRARGIDWLKSEADRLKGYEKLVRPQRSGKGWGWSS